MAGSEPWASTRDENVAEDDDDDENAPLKPGARSRGAYKKKRTPRIWRYRFQPYIDTPIYKIFDPQFSDAVGRNYCVLESGPLFDEYVARGNINLATWASPITYMREAAPGTEREDKDFGTQILLFRMPLYRDKRVPIDPEIDGGYIKLTDMATTRVCTITYEQCVWNKKSRFGTLICTSFKVSNDFADE